MVDSRRGGDVRIDFRRIHFEQAIEWCSGEGSEGEARDIDY